MAPPRKAKAKLKTQRQIAKRAILSNAAFLAACLFLVLPTISNASPTISARLNEQKIDGHFVVAGQLEFKPADELEKALSKGVEYTLTFDWEIERKADSWYLLDRTKHESTDQVRIRFDPTNKSYLVIRNKSKSPFFTFAEAWQNAVTVNKRVSYKEFPKGRYLLRVRAKGESLRLYFPLDTIYRAFVSKLDFSLNWQEFLLTLP